MSVHRSQWIGRLALLIALAAPVMAQSPPRELKLVGDHWTAWDPPASVEEGAEVYIIVEGDTLWDLAQRFYDNPYLWPQLWERNQYILDAHWIYPGDPLVLGIEVESADVLGGPHDRAAGEEGEGEPGLDSMETFLARAGEPENPFVQLGTSDDIYCSGYIGESNERFPYYISGSEFDVQNPSLAIGKRGKVESVYGNVDAGRVNLSLGDIVYIDGGRSAGLAPGDVFTAIRKGRRIQHPRTKRSVGRYYSYQGRVRVLSVQEQTAIAEVSQSCEPITVGSALKPFVPEPIPSERQTPMRPVNLPVARAELRSAPLILHSEMGVISLGKDHVVFVDVGEQDNVVPGDIFTIYRDGRRKNPPLVLGEVAILSVHRVSSTAKIITSRFPVYVGDAIIPK